MFAIVAALGKLAIPILIQVILDRGVLDSGGFRAEFVLLACLGAVVITIGVLFISRIAYFRLVRAAEQALCNLRVRVFDHIHRLSMAEHTTTRRGVFVSRVTSDIETLARFVQWGMISWLVNGTLIVGTLIVMFVYSWQLTLLVLVAYAPVLPLFRAFQRRQLQAYDEERTRIGDMIAEFSETVTGAAVIRAYGLQDRARVRLRERIDSAYRARVRAAKYFAAMFPLGDFFGAIATAAVVVAAAYYGTEWGLDVGKVVAFMFLINLLLSPIGELSEILDQTQTAISGWRKVLAVLDVPIDVAEPADGVHLAHGALAVEVSHIGFAYRGRRARAARRERRHRGRHARRGRRRDGFGQDDVREAPVPAGRSDRRATCASATPTSATSTPLPAGARSAWCRRTASCSTRRSPTTCAWPHRTPRTTTSNAPSLASGSTGG